MTLIRNRFVSLSLLTLHGLAALLITVVCGIIVVFGTLFFDDPRVSYSSFLLHWGLFPIIALFSFAGSCWVHCKGKYDLSLFILFSAIVTSLMTYALL